MERTNKAELSPGEQSKKAKSRQKNLLNEIVERAIKTEIDTRTE